MPERKYKTLKKIISHHQKKTPAETETKAESPARFPVPTQKKPEPWSRPVTEY